MWGVYMSYLAGVLLLWLGAAHLDITEIFPFDHIVVIDCCCCEKKVEDPKLAPRSAAFELFPYRLLSPRYVISVNIYF